MSRPAMTNTAGLSGAEIGRPACCPVPNPPSTVSDAIMKAMEVQLCESDASVNINQQEGKVDIKAFRFKSSEAKCWTKCGVGNN